MDNETRLSDLGRIREDIRVEYLHELKSMANQILERAKVANDTNVSELLEKYVIPVVNEHLTAAKTDQKIQPTF